MEELQSLNRRSFLKKAGSLVAASAFIGIPEWAEAKDSGDIKLTILHTNDVHSRIDPFPMDGSRNQGLGGAARRASLISKIRSEEKNVLLFDAGDAVQGTPYFNLFNGDMEMEIMNKLGYDAATFGNHEFDNGVEKLAEMISKANFPYINTNYKFEGTPLENKVLPYKIFNKGGVKIGVFGLGLQLDGLVDPLLSKGVIYQDPTPIAIRTADWLKLEKNCSLVICLSHLGYRYGNDKISDVKLAENTRNIDLIIGGHTHTFLDEPVEVKNLTGNTTIINQVGFAGINLGRIDFVFEKTTKKQKVANSLNLSV